MSLTLVIKWVTNDYISTVYSPWSVLFLTFCRSLDSIFICAKMFIVMKPRDCSGLRHAPQEVLYGEDWCNSCCHVDINTGVFQDCSKVSGWETMSDSLGGVVLKTRKRGLFIACVMTSAGIDILYGFIISMMTSWHGNAFCITGPLWGESIEGRHVGSPQKGSVQRTFAASLNKLFSK